MAAIKGLIFDLDGTLIDNYESYLEHMLGLVGKDMGRDFSLSQAKDLWYSIGKESRDEVIESWGVNPDRFWPIFGKYESLEKKLKNTYLHKDVEVLRKLALPMGIVTHTSYEHTDSLLKLVGIRDLFKYIIACTEDIGFKPSPLPLIYCVMEMGLGFDEVLYVGDTVSDILAARNAHIKSVYINRYGRKIAIQPDFEIDSLSKILDIVNGNN